MSCPDVKDLLFGEVKEPERSARLAHLSACEACALEYERLEATAAALKLVPEEEPPVRIRFVSDRVFEQRWWQRALGGGAIWANAGFALATCAAAVTLIWFEASRPGAAGGQQAGNASSAEVQRLVDARVAAAVTQAVAESDRRHDGEMKAMLTAFEREQTERQQKLVRQIEAAWQVDDAIKTRALYAAYEKPVMGQ